MWIGRRYGRKNENEEHYEKIPGADTLKEGNGTHSSTLARDREA